MEDGEAVVAALLQANASPVTRPIAETKLKYKPRIFRTNLGNVTVPERESEDSRSVPQDAEQTPEAKEPAVHGEIQWVLARLGNDMGLQVWVGAERPQ